MDILKQGTLCVIVGGCPENIGLIVAVIQHLGRYGSKQDAYHVRTVSGRHFHQLWTGGTLTRGHTDKCITDRHKLRPLVESGVMTESAHREVAIDTGGTDRPQHTAPQLDFGVAALIGA